MNTETVYNLGRLYRWLSEELGGVNQPDIDAASRYPLRQLSFKITLAHRLHKMTPELDRACTYVLRDITIEEMEASCAQKAISISQQGTFMLGYMNPNYRGFDIEPLSIKKAREDAGYSIRGLAEKIGVSATTIQNAESGKTSPKVDTLQKIADACDVSVMDFWPKSK